MMFMLASLQNSRLLTDVKSIWDYPLISTKDSEITLANFVIFLCAVVLVFLGESILRRYLVRRFLQRTHFHPSMQYAIGKIAGYAFIALGIYVSLKVVGIDLSSLAFIAGAFGIGLGFGLQNIISNFVSGLIVLAERPITIGDRVEIGGVAGQVAKINMRSTVITTNDNSSVIVPNSDFITSKVINWSYGDPKVRMRIPIGVAYGTDPQVVKRLLMEVAASDHMVLREPAPDVFFIAFGDNSLNFELAVWTEEMASKPRALKSELNFAIEKKLRENNIEIPFPQRDIHIRSGAVPESLQSMMQKPPSSTSGT